MKALITAICVTAMALSLRAQMVGVRGMSARPAGPRFVSGPRFRPMPPLARFPMSGHAPVLVGHPHHGVFFDPFFNGSLFHRRFFRSPFCFHNPFFCRKLFFDRALFFGGFGAFGAVPPFGFPVVTSAAADPVATDAGASEQESAALAELQRELQEERQHREALEQRVADMRANQGNRVQTEAGAGADTSTPSTLLVFSNRSRTEIRNYAIVGNLLYVFTPQRTTKIPVSRLDLTATIKANVERGVDFHLPRAGQVVTYP